MPIKLNIQCINKEKLSKIKSIIEKSSAYHNFYRIEFPNRNKAISEEKKNKELEEEKNNKKLIFKKKKIEMVGKENRRNQFKNNFLIISPMSLEKNKYKKANKIINNTKIKDNNQIQSLVASYNLNINNENNKIQKNNENIISTKESEQNSFLNKEKTFKKKKINNKKNITELENNNDDDTMSLSYSKERDINIFSDRKKNEEISISLPFLVEHFNMQYNIYNNKLIINDNKKNNDKGSKKNSVNFDSEDDNYQLTKEIILLKKGLAKKTELSGEIKRKLRVIIPQRIYNLTLEGIKRIYKRKKSSYINHRL